MPLRQNAASAKCRIGGMAWHPLKRNWTRNQSFVILTFAVASYMTIKSFFCVICENWSKLKMSTTIVKVTGGWYIQETPYDTLTIILKMVDPRLVSFLLCLMLLIKRYFYLNCGLYYKCL